VNLSKLAEDKSEDFAQAIGNYIMQHDVPFFYLLWKYYGSQNYSRKYHREQYIVVAKILRL
jgi:hypothetical protein